MGRHKSRGINKIRAKSFVARVCGSIKNLSDVASNFITYEITKSEQIAFVHVLCEGVFTRAEFTNLRSSLSSRLRKILIICPQIFCCKYSARILSQDNQKLRALSIGAIGVSNLSLQKLGLGTDRQLILALYDRTQVRAKRAEMKGAKICRSQSSARSHKRVGNGGKFDPYQRESDITAA